MFANIKNFFIQPVIISSTVVTAILFASQYFRVFEEPEIQVFDRMMQIHAKEQPDSRLLVVGLTEEDIAKYQHPLRDELFLQVLNELEKHRPRAIGFDFYRDRASTNDEEGHAKLLQHLKDSSIIFPICNHADSQGTNKSEVAPPQGVDPEQVGFSNLVEDGDGIIRRNLLLLNVNSASKCTTSYSLGLQLALKYLEVGGTQVKSSANKELQIGKVVLPPLKNYSGGYQRSDAEVGYQILLNYRTRQIAEQVTIDDVLTGKVKPELIQDRVVLIGAVAPSLNDIVNTPLSSGSRNSSDKMPGVVVHAHSVSQILSAVIDNKPLFWFLPEWGEVIWLWGWSVVGGLVVLRLRHPIVLVLLSGVSGAVLLGGSFFLFTQAAWFPVVSPLLGFVLTGGSVLAYSAYQSKQEQEKILKQVQAQQDAIAQLQILLKQTGGNRDNTEVVTPVGLKMSPGTMLRDRYKIIKELAAGGFGGTYLAEDTQRPGNPVHVVKQLRPVRQDTQFLQVARRLFKQEAEILEVVGKHDCIPQLMACFEENQQFFIVQEYIKGVPLNQEISKGKKLSESQVVQILKDVLEILVFIHSYNIIHRDIKPSNLIRREQDGRIVLIDFGAVKKIQPQQPETQTVAIATIGYAPSEQISGLPKLNSDIHALGITAIEALTGIEPKRYQRNVDTGEIEILVSADIPPQSWRIVAQISPELAQIINQMVHFDFNSRYQSATDVLKDWKTIKI